VDRRFVFWHGQRQQRRPHLQALAGVRGQFFGVDRGGVLLVRERRGIGQRGAVGGRRRDVPQRQHLRFVAQAIGAALGIGLGDRPQRDGNVAAGGHSPRHSQQPAHIGVVGQVRQVAVGAARRDQFGSTAVSEKRLARVEDQQPPLALDQRAPRAQIAQRQVVVRVRNFAAQCQPSQAPDFVIRVAGEGVVRVLLAPASQQLLLLIGRQGQRRNASLGEGWQVVGGHRSGRVTQRAGEGLCQRSQASVPHIARAFHAD